MVFGFFYDAQASFEAAKEKAGAAVKEVKEKAEAAARVAKKKADAAAKAVKEKADAAKKHASGLFDGPNRGIITHSHTHPFTALCLTYSPNTYSAAALMRQAEVIFLKVAALDGNASQEKSFPLNNAQS